MTENPPPLPLPPPAAQARPGAPYATAPGRVPLYPYGAPISVPLGLGTAALVLAALLTLVQVGLGVLSWPVAEELGRATQGGALDMTVLNAYDGLAVLLLVVGVAAYVLNCLWLHQVRRNAEVVVPQHRHARGPVWVWLGWWVPIVAVWFPYQVVRDVTGARQRHQPATGLALWWAGWLVWAGASRASAGMLEPATQRTDFTAFAVLETVATVGLLVALARWVVIVRRTNQHQREWLQAGVAAT